MCKISMNEYLCFSVISLTYTKENRWLVSQLSWAKEINVCNPRAAWISGCLCGCSTGLNRSLISNIPFKTILIRNSLNPNLTWHIWYFCPTLNLHSNLEFCGFEKHKTKPNLLNQSKTQLIWINSPSRAEPSRTPWLWAAGGVVTLLDWLILQLLVVCSSLSSAANTQTESTG